MTALARAEQAATEGDKLAIKAMQDFRADENVRVKARADKWIVGLGAVTAVLTTAIIVKGAETFADLKPTLLPWGQTVATEHLVVGLMVAGATAITMGILWAYSAAYGGPIGRDPMTKASDNQEPTGALIRWKDAIREQETSTRRRLGLGVVATVVGTACLALAVGFTWLTPSAKFTCFEVDGVIVKFEGEAPTLVGDTDFKFDECPVG